MERERFIDNTPARETNPMLVVAQILKVRGMDIEFVEKGFDGCGEFSLEGFVALVGDQEARGTLSKISETAVFDLLVQADTHGHFDGDWAVDEGLDQTIVQKLIVFSLERAAAKDEELAALFEARDELLAGEWRRSSKDLRKTAEAIMAFYGLTRLKPFDISKLLEVEVDKVTV